MSKHPGTESAGAPEVDAAFPGGNIVVEDFSGDEFKLHQDLRDTEGKWFYWCFRIRGAAKRTLTFRFTASTAIGVRGPAISCDGGDTWNWLGSESVEENSFRYSFADDAGEVRFSFGMPYQQAQLETFLAGHSGDPRLVPEVLCHSRKGRPVERLRFGRVDGTPDWRVLLTCRHHCCEMMANYVLEGLIDGVLSGTEAGKWLSERVEFAAIPFVDKDGVEDGDQGKNRRPHDHCVDYAESGSIHIETAAIREWTPGWLAGKRTLCVDLHCPWIRGRFHEVVMLPVRARDPQNWKRQQPFLESLEKLQSGVLGFRLADSREFSTWDGKPYAPHPERRSFSMWAGTLESVGFGTVFEIPYANAGGHEVNQETARAFGQDLATALHAYLRGE